MEFSAFDMGGKRNSVVGGGVCAHKYVLALGAEWEKDLQQAFERICWNNVYILHNTIIYTGQIVSFFIATTFGFR